MAEATEEIVRLYLEQLGYVVTLSKRVSAKTTKHSGRAELDLIAIKNKKDNNCSLPLRIAGEVKSYQVNVNGFQKLYEKLRKQNGLKSRNEYSRYKWVNDKCYRKAILDSLNEEYGFKDFTFVLFCDGIRPKYDQMIVDFLKSESIYLVKHIDIVKSLYENTSSEYTNDTIHQLLRMIKSQTKKIEFKDDNS